MIEIPSILRPISNGPLNPNSLLLFLGGHKNLLTRQFNSKFISLHLLGHSLPFRGFNVTESARVSYFDWLGVASVQWVSSLTVGSNSLKWLKLISSLFQTIFKSLLIGQNRQSSPKIVFAHVPDSSQNHMKRVSFSRVRWWWWFTWGSGLPLLPGSGWLYP